MQQWYFSTAHYKNMMSDAQNFAMGFWRLEPGVNDGHIINYQIVGNGSRRVPHVPPTGPVILNITNVSKFPQDTCLLNMLESEDGGDNSINYWGQRIFKFDEDGEIKIYGIPRGKYNLDCGKDRSNIRIRVSGQSYKRYMIIEPYGGN